MEIKEILWNLERKREFWITGKAGYKYAELKLDIGNLELHIKDRKLMLNNQEDVILKINDVPYKEKEYIVENGDIFTFYGYTMTFFENWIELSGDLTGCECSLLKVAGEQDKFQGYPYYKRSPRVIYTIKDEKIDIKTPPQKKVMSKDGIVQMIVPTLSTLAFTILMGIVMKRGSYVYMSAGMTVITTFFSIKKFLSQRKENKEQNLAREQIYTDYLLNVRKEIRQKRGQEREALEYQAPTASRIQNMILNYSSRLYERTPLDGDFMTVNLGYYSGASQIEIAYGRDNLEVEKDILAENAKKIVRDYGKIDRIPVNIDLKNAHLGLVGSKKNIHEQLKCLILQLTFFQSYHDLQIVFIHKDTYKEDFSYLRWYPHLKLQALNVVGDIYNEQVRDQILGSIQQILKERKQKQEEEHQETVFTPHFLFIIDEPKLILNHAIMEYLQYANGELGFSLIYTTDQHSNLPENIRTVCIIENTNDGRLLLEEGRRVNLAFQLDHVGEIALEQSARTLSAIVHEQGISSKIPESITFFDMYQIEHPEDLHVRERWKKNQSHKSLAVPLGVRAEEDYVELNLHEKAHGPHGLVAGTTGSGKSEIVQSYILSLAVNFHPHEVGFLLIDYKGGGMANLFTRLPHLLGTITNLDKAESMRAMASINSELSRRQELFLKNNVNHINGYNKLFKLGKVKEPLPHLFLISDEFAELKKEQPEFMSELISTARIGRSLGIHLILATQKPSGVVDDQIWTNSKFKLCLKVQNAGDSKEMLKTPDAANITQAGRAYLQVGNNEIYELFQSAWSGAVYGGEQTEEEKEDDRVYLVNSLGQGELINQDLSGPQESNQIKETQLDVIVKHLQEIYEEEDAVSVMKPWLPSLPAPMCSPHTADVRDSADFEIQDYTLGIGMVDIPEEQKQEEYILDFLKNGHLLYMASSGYGKTMFLTNIIVGLSMKNAVKNLNFYILDLGNSALIPLKGIPHVADYMGLDDTEKIQKFQKYILDEIAARKRLFAKAMVQNIYVYNESQQEKLRVIVIAIDNFETIKELGDSVEPFIQKVARDGASLGVYLVVTMSRGNSMRSSIQNNFKEKIAGFNFDESENRGLIGRSSHVVPEDKKGRALVKRDNVNVMQLYTPVPCENELSYNDNLKSLINRIAQASTEERAKGIPTLPDELYYDMLPEYPDYENTTTKIPVGIDTEELKVQYLDLVQGLAMIIGTGGMGRTNAIKNVIWHLRGQKIYLFDAKNGNLRMYEQMDYITYGGDESTSERLIQELETEIERRKALYDEQVGISVTFKEYGRTLEPVYILVDIVQELQERLGADDKKLDVLAKAVQSGMFVIVTSDAKLRARNSEFLNMLVDSKSGLVLGNIKDQSVFSYTRIREENCNVDFGYFHNKGVNKKIKLIQYVQQKEGE